MKPFLSAKELYILSITQPVSSTSEGSSASLSSSSSSSPSSSSPITTSFSPPPPLGPAVEPLFKTEFFEAHHSPKGGYGAFAIKDIPKDAVIIMEEALFTGTLVEVFHQFEQLSPEQRKDYMKLHAYRGFDTHKIPSIFKTNR